MFRPRDRPPTAPKEREQGVYILKFSDETIKIGKSRNVARRLKSYRGYMSHGQDPVVLKIFKTKHYSAFEKHLHAQAVSRGLKRQGRLEIFWTRDAQSFVRHAEAECEKFHAKRGA